MNSSSQHRLATQPAIRAFEAFRAPGFSFNSNNLDNAFGGTGLKRGQISEICGPSGSGKTTLALNVAASALSAGYKVIWIETCQRIPLERLKYMLSCQVQSSQAEEVEPTEDVLSLLEIVHVPHLAQLVVFIQQMNLQKKIEDENLGLVVIDNLSTAIQLAFPTNPDDYHAARARSERRRTQSLSSASNKENISPLKRTPVTGTTTESSSSHTVNSSFPKARESMKLRKKRVEGELSSMLSRMASFYQAAVLVTTQLTSKIEPGAGAKMTPFLGRAWTSSLANRLILYFRHPTSEIRIPDDVRRDSSAHISTGDHRKLRYGYMAKQATPNASDRELVFYVRPTGLQDLQVISISSSQRRKRILSEVD
ncbi:RecA family ATPase Rhp55 [Schizosaccharomyces japonicus yFS275]|uniref:RecA family ATPase Rhp55 n=1 Tax=Schizosaccharomyces japonicus (strain yFS275 / FY16936) TaxID=402676 RepID=B6K0Z0_SCHJY|nr:RecA family ATPase Rhp55 [Schizosaccharomyces japonicus yFS275]EEB07611.1 RecA family ATPase Rhp55 [Schizosaccharomyces japonicus yFS275]